MNDIYKQDSQPYKLDKSDFNSFDEFLFYSRYGQANWTGIDSQLKLFYILNHIDNAIRNNNANFTQYCYVMAFSHRYLRDTAYYINWFKSNNFIRFLNFGSVYKDLRCEDIKNCIPKSAFSCFREIACQESKYLKRANEITYQWFIQWERSENYVVIHGLTEKERELVKKIYDKG